MRHTVSACERRSSPTGLEQTPPSPNLRTLTEAVLYPAVGLIEGANASVGRGSATPVGLVGAPWIDGQTLADALVGRSIPGIRFAPATFAPAEDRYHGQACADVQMR